MPDVPCASETSPVLHLGTTHEGPAKEPDSVLPVLSGPTIKFFDESPARSQLLREEFLKGTPMPTPTDLAVEPAVPQEPSLLLSDSTSSAQTEEPQAHTVSAEASTEASVVHPVAAPFTSLYYTQTGTFAAIACGLTIVLAVQFAVARIFRVAKTVIEALTFFATSMVAILVGIYICDMLIAGPDVMLLHEGERSSIVNFVKDTCLMVFAYFFGTKSVSTPTGGADE